MRGGGEGEIMDAKLKGGCERWGRGAYGWRLVEKGTKMRERLWDTKLKGREHISGVSVVVSVLHQFEHEVRVATVQLVRQPLQRPSNPNRERYETSNLTRRSERYMRMGSA